MKLEVRNGSFGYDSKKSKEPTKYIINDINIEIDQGQVLTILGPNGVGKTTMLKCILGLLDWKEGATYLDGTNIKEIENREFWRNIGYVPQAKMHTFSYKVEEMVVLGRNAHLGPLSQPGDKEYEIAYEAIEEIGISHLIGRDCNSLSGGELQMVLIARALCAQPSILVLDEPESNLDFKNQLIVMKTLEKLSRESNKTILINTHYPDHAIQISDKTLLAGKDFNKFGPSKEVITEENLERIFDVRVYIRDVPLEEDETYTNVIPMM